MGSIHGEMIMIVALYSSLEAESVSWVESEMASKAELGTVFGLTLGALVINCQRRRNWLGVGGPEGF